MDTTINKWIKVFDMPDGNQVLFINAGKHIPQIKIYPSVAEYSVQMSVKIEDHLLTKVKVFYSPEDADLYFSKMQMMNATTVYKEAQAHISKKLNPETNEG